MFNRFLFAALFVMLSALCGAQNVAMTLQESVNRNIVIEELYQSYPKAITDKNDDDPVFKGAEDVCYTAYVKFISEFAEYLKEQNFRWGRATRCYNQIFFSEDGRVEYFIYEFPKGSLSAERAAEYDKLLNTFLHSFCFRVTSDRAFSMNGYITFKDLR